ncbi:LysR family transcriptional regulator [Serratia sp. M24T3]|nr:LysR family transcriptional regulator [Serratia sp. M24T3]
MNFYSAQFLTLIYADSFMTDIDKINIEAIDLNLLKVLEALHEEGSASRAAVRLGLTQSAVSAALGRLRRLYDDHLFVRTGRGLAPTLRANELKPLVSEALDKCRQSLQLVSGVRAGYAGRSLSLGLSDDFELALGRQLIDRLEQEMPGLRIVFRQTHSRIVGEMLMNREVDLAIASGGFTSAAVGSETLGEGRYACLIDSRQPLMAGEIDNNNHLSLQAFLRRQHLLISSGGFIGMVDEVLIPQGLKRSIRASTTHFAALPYLLLGSDALATIPLHAARTLAAFHPLKLLFPPVSMPAYSVNLGWRRDALRDPAVVKMKQIISEIFSGFDWQSEAGGQ